MNSDEKLFEEIKTNTEYLHSNPELDNEAMRHDLLVYPLLKSGLGWDSKDLLSQRSIQVPSKIRKSHIFRGGVPRKRTPDIVIATADIPLNLLVLEEKRKQNSISELNEHRCQLHEYQSLFESIWGVLTDGEKWILKKNFENYHDFSNLNELFSGLQDLRHAIGKEAMSDRYRKHGSVDLLNVVYVPSRCLSIETSNIIKSISIEELIIEALNLQERNRSVFSAFPVKVQDLVNHFGKKYFQGEINFVPYDSPSSGMHGYSKVDSEKVEIHYNRQLNHCWTRYTIVKELFNIILNTDAYSKINTESTVVEEAINSILGDFHMNAQSPRTDLVSEILALSSLMPVANWEKIEGRINDNSLSLYQVSNKFKIPEKKVNMYLSVIYPNTKSLIQMLRSIG